MDNIDVDALVNARDNGAMIMYFANVATRLQGGNLTQTTTPRRNQPTLRQAVQAAPMPVQNLNEETPVAQPEPRTAPRPAPVRNAQNNAQDRVRVSRL